MQSRPRILRLFGSARRCAVAAATVLLVLAVVARIWLFACGFDISDEGFYLTTAAHPEDENRLPSFFGWMLHPLYRVVGSSLLLFRSTGLALLFLSGTTLARGALAQSPNWRKHAIAPVIAGALTYYAAGMPTPSYNLVTACGLQVCLGSLLIALRGESRPSAWAALSGAMGSVAALSKPPAALLVIVFACILAVCSWRMLRFFLGGALFVLTILAVAAGPQRLATSLLLGIDFSASLTYSVGSLTSTFARGLRAVLGDSVKTTVPALVAYALISRLSPLWARPLAVLALAITLVGREMLNAGVAAVWSGVVAAGLAATLITLAVIEASRFKMLLKTGPRESAILFLLAVSPFFGVLGTDQALGKALCFQMTPWFLIPSLIAALRGRTPSSSGGLLLALVVANCSLGEALLDPYRTRPVSEASTVAPLGPRHGWILTDRTTALFIRDLNRAAGRCGLSIPGTIVVLDSTAGVAHLLGLRVVDHGFYYRPGLYHTPELRRGARRAVEAALSQIEPTILEKSFISRVGSEAWPRTLVLSGRRLCFSGVWPGTGDPIELLGPFH